MIQPAIIEKLDALPTSLQTEVLHYIEFLPERYVDQKNVSNSRVKMRDAFGVWQGKIWVSDDFDEPLEDMKDYMQSCEY